MGKRISTLGFLYWLILLLLAGCSDTASSGSGTATGNPIIIGTVTDSIGNTVANARIIIRPIDYKPYDTYLDFLVKEDVDSLGYAYSDEKGNFSVGLTDTGDYYIQIIEDTSARAKGISDSIYVSEQHNYLNLKTKKIIDLDTLRGTINLLGGPICPIIVKVVGREVADTIESGTEFKLPLPYGRHNFLIMPLDTTTYREVLPYSQFPSFTNLGNIHLIAKDPISKSRACDSLIIHNILAFNGVFGKIMIQNASEGKDTVIYYHQIESLLVHHSNIEESEEGRITAVSFTEGQISTVFSMIGGLTELTTLSIENGSTKSLPTTIGRLSKLDTLSLKGNQLTTLPTTITMLNNLSYLNLEANKITELPAEVKEWADALDPDWATTQKQ